MSKNEKTVEKYFAAANGYRGFVSYFQKVFSPSEYDAVFVIKGGPGTGKSSFMKKTSEALARAGCDVEEIYCSSDPKSLDGVIGVNADKRVALLDGTAPHEEDAKIPGAVGRIINLGDNWDEEWLSAYRKEIISLSKEKSDAYRRAYFYLSVSGILSDEINRTHIACCDAKNLKSRAKNLAESILERGAGNEKTRLISSFGRYGKYSLGTFDGIAKRRISPRGATGETELFMTFLYSYLHDESQDMTVCPSPFDESKIEAIYLPQKEILISPDTEGETLEVGMPKDDSFAVCEEGVRVAKAILADALSEAERWFAIASELHFGLEEIYTRAMNFEKNDRTYEITLEKINKILGL